MIETPAKWVALVSDWERINWSVIESVALPAIAKGEKLGVLLMDSLEPGRRSEQTLKRSGVDLWTGLAPLGEHVESLKIEQVVFPPGLVEFARSLTAATGTSLRLLARSMGEISLAIDGVDVRIPVPAAARCKFLTLDILRARLGSDAVAALSRRIRIPGADVVLAANGPPGLAMVDLQLQKCGARTFHLFHGALGDDWVGAPEHNSTFHLAWTDNDARCLESIRDRVVVMGMPQRIAPAKRAQSAPVILLLTSYLHRDHRGIRDPSAYEDEMLRLVPLVGGAAEVRFLWRPHPASLKAALAKRAPSLAPWSVELSEGRSLQSDVARADIIVSNLSTVFAECLFAEVPVFLHVMPQHWSSAGADFIDPERRFFEARDGARKVLRELARLGDGRPDTGPERAARMSLWGAGQLPDRIDLTSSKFSPTSLQPKA